MLSRIHKSFQSIFHSKPEFTVRAPGRVNLIGEHTDYNEGFVLPMAIDRAVWIALRPRPDRRVSVHSLDLGLAADFELDSLTRGGDARWEEYLKGVAHELQVDGFKLQGWEGVMTGDVPRGAGLSSSAALEVATARAFASVSGFAWEPLRIAKVGQRAENNWMGVKSGIMDQAVSAAAKAGHALFLDCRTLEYEHVPLPKDVAVVVMDTSTRRGLVDSAYNERRSQCESAAQFFGVQSLRDRSVEEFEERGKPVLSRVEGKKEDIEDVIWRRARHIVTENARVLKAVEAMRAGDLFTLGKLFNESHASLRDDFEVTSDALNWMVEIAQSQPACFGARMTGAGFGGCAVAVVRREQAGAFAEVVGAEYKLKSGKEAGIFVCEAGEGASVIK
jgi:galactokinase